MSEQNKNMNLFCLQTAFIVYARRIVQALEGS